MEQLYYIARGVTNAACFYLQPPTMVLEIRYNRTWFTISENDNELCCGSFYPEKLKKLNILNVPKGQCWLVSIETFENSTVIQLLDNNVKCKIDVRNNF